MRQAALGILLLLAPWILSPVAAGDSSAVEKVRTWLEAEINRPEQLPHLPDIALKFAYEMHWPLSRTEVERLRPVVADKPDHPQGRLVALADQRRESGPEIVVSTIRIRGDEWRLSNDYAHESMPYHDIVVTDRRAWSMNSQQLVLIDRTRGWPPKWPLERRRSDILNATHALLRGDLAPADGEEVAIASVVVADGKWVGKVERASGRIERIVGRWSPADGRGFVEEIEIIPREGSSDSDGSKIRVSGWSFHEALQGWVASDVVHLFPDGSIARRFRLVSVEREEPGYFDRVVAMPRFDGVDPLRGPVTATSIHDYSGARDEYVEHTAAGTTRRSLEGSRADTRASLRWAGWLSASAIVFALAAIRIMRNRALSGAA